jgi:hypothetical protein
MSTAALAFYAFLAGLGFGAPLGFALMAYVLSRRPRRWRPPLELDQDALRKGLPVERNADVMERGP